MTQTPKTKSVPISPLKRLNGHLFDTTTTLVDGHWVGSIALVAVCSDHTPNKPRFGRIFGVVASTMVLEVDPTTHSKFLN